LAAITCQLQGSLLIRDVMGRAAELRQALDAGARSFDLGGVSAIDTAGVQLLVALAQEAARRQQRISLRGCARVVMPATRALGLGPELDSLMTEVA
jgi:ABC-type transporter Mla MlaB component